MSVATQYPTSVLLLIPLLLGGRTSHPAASMSPTEAAAPAPPFAPGSPPFQVSGTAVHYVNLEVIHSQVPTGTGMIQRSTGTIQLSGDLNGLMLVHVTIVIDMAAGTVVNTGTQLFSGSVAGSEPLILHDDQFRFDVDLFAGTATGSVHLGRSKDAPDQGGWFECDLEVVPTGVTPEGNHKSGYSGQCIGRGTQQ